VPDELDVRVGEGAHEKLDGGDHAKGGEPLTGQTRGARGPVKTPEASGESSDEENGGPGRGDGPEGEAQIAPEREAARQLARRSSLFLGEVAEAGRPHVRRSFGGPAGDRDRPRRALEVEQREAVVTGRALEGLLNLGRPVARVRRVGGGSGVAQIVGGQAEPGQIGGGLGRVRQQLVKDGVVESGAPNPPGNLKELPDRHDAQAEREG
jgi:hypothetical protein